MKIYILNLIYIFDFKRFWGQKKKVKTLKPCPAFSAVSLEFLDLFALFNLFFFLLKDKNFKPGLK